MKAIIVGGGIGGCTTAIALKHFGIASEIYEAAPELKEVGAGLWIAPNAMKVYDLLGIAEEIQDAGTCYTNAIGVGNTEGEVLRRIDCQEIYERFGYYTTAIHRARLHELLVQHAGNVTVDKRLERYEEQGDKVIASFTDGSRAEGDILIGADGIKSTVRKQMLGPIPYRYTGQTCWRLIAPYELDEEQSNIMLELWGNQPGLRAAYGSVGKGQTYAYFTQAAAPGGKDNSAQLKETLLSLYNEFPTCIHQLIEATPVEQILRNDLYDFAPIFTWSQGRVVLVGDAAHATTPNLGQGACQAVESAYIVSKCIAEETTLKDAFARYQRERIKKAHFITRTSWNFGRATHMRFGWMRRLRNFFLKHTPKSYGHSMNERIYSFSG